MKRFWLVLLSLGLVMAFSASAFAVDVKVSGEYYAAGMYLDKTSVYGNTERPWAPSQNSTAFFYQRLRVGTDFVVSPCLKLVTRFDAMERIWGGARDGYYYDAQSVETRFENENIAFDLVYIDYTSPIGLFRVGYQPDYVWGTVFGDRSKGPSAGQITYGVPIGPVTIVAQYAKEGENSLNATNSYYGVNTTDRDYDSYRVGAIYNFNTARAKGEVGALLLYNRDAENRNLTNSMVPGLDFGYLTEVYKVIPYFKAKVGPVDIQGELEYTFGDAIKGETSALSSPPFNQPDMDIDAWSVFLDATANFGRFYAGGSFVYLSGDDPGTPDKLEGSNSLAAVNTVGLDWNPCLMMFNTETFGYWVGGVSGHDNTVIGEEMSNVIFGQLRVGARPTPQLDINLSIAYAVADEKPQGFGNDDYGTEIDLTGTYKITNNLSYMLGAGYLFTGDYYKGYNTNGNNDVDDDFIVLNKLTLSF